MATPMPPPPEGSPQEEQGESPAQEGQEPDQAQGGSVSDLIISVDKGLARIIGLMGQAKGVDPKAVQAITQAAQLFQTGIQTLVGKGGGPQPANQGSSPMEAGGAQGAVPAM